MADGPAPPSATARCCPSQATQGPRPSGAEHCCVPSATSRSHSWPTPGSRGLPSSAAALARGPGCDASPTRAPRRPQRARVRGDRPATSTARRGPVAAPQSAGARLRRAPRRRRSLLPDA
eukprot:8582718-Lingulodinium_polyedra.AAC.1